MRNHWANICCNRAISCATLGPAIVYVAFHQVLPSALVSSTSNRWAWGTASQLVIGNPESANFSAASILWNTWLANSPQVVLSAIYFFFNRLLTQLASAVEWGHWAKHRKHLRVSKPEGSQRSTHFLQLPYKMAVPMIVYSGVLHWLLSQTLFLRRLEVRDREGNILSDKSLCTVGYSPVSLLVFVVMAFIGAVLIVRLSFWLKPSKRMPWGANSSLVLSAACHPPPTDADAQLNGLQWGVVKSRFPGTTVGHCCFTSEDVTPPEADNRYA